MTKYLLILIFNVVINNISAQSIVFNAKITNEIGDIVTDSQLFLNKKLITPKIENTHFIFNVNPGDTIVLRHFDFEQNVYCVPQRISEDSINYTFVLTIKHLQMEEFVITATSSRDKKHKIAGELNENILDYLINPILNYILTVKTIHDDYFIGFKNDSLETNFKINFIPISINLDCFGNTHVLTKDSVYQIYITPKIELKFIEILTLTKYKIYISKLISNTTNNVYFEKKTIDNQKYTIVSQSKNNFSEVVYSDVNENTYSVTKKEFNDIVTLYYSVTDDSENLIKLGKWDGQYSSLSSNEEVVDLINTNKLFFTESMSSCYGFGMIDHICVINFNTDQIIKIKYDSHFKTIVPIETKKIKNKTIILDYFYDKVYILASDHGQLSIFQLNEKTGKKTKVGEFDGVVSPTKIKIYGDSYYYLKRNEAGYNKLYQVKSRII